MKTATLAPPIAPKKPYAHETHGHRRDDPYHWLRQKDAPETTAYLEAENAYAEKAMAPLSRFRDALFAEMKGRVKQDDRSAPVRIDQYWYYFKYAEGQEYPVHYRRRLDAPESEEEMILDQNALAEGKDYYSVQGLGISDDHRIMAYAEDAKGDRVCTIRFKDLQTGQTLPDALERADGGMAWAADGQTIFFTRMDEETLRPHQALRYRLGSGEPPALVYEETDETFGLHVSRSRTRKYVLLASTASVTTEVRLLPADAPESEPAVFAPRRRGHEYAVEHIGEKFLVRSNEQARNFRLMETPETDTAEANWREVVPHRENVLLEGFLPFEGFLALEERSNGLTGIRVIGQGGESHSVGFGEEVYTAYLGYNNHVDTTTLRFHYNSLTTPASAYDYDMASREKTLVKRQEVVGDFDPSRYESKRLHAAAPDGTLVPMSLVRRKDAPAGPAPLYLTGYGAYGISTDPYFSSVRLSLLDRGVTFVMAHVRGGEDLGRHWYEEGKLFNKKNTFSDFVACAETLLAEGHAASDQLAISGGSAGGLLVGATVNLKPELFMAAVADVPFVDVVTTMLDRSIPLTTGEYDEWGNPEDKAFYDYILSYSPYDNVEAKAYPHMLVTAGLHDTAVHYWEPAKWVARLRERKTDDNRLLLFTNMSAGHTGASGRFERFKDVAREYAFLLDLWGKADDPTL